MNHIHHNPDAYSFGKNRSAGERLGRRSFKQGAAEPAHNKEKVKSEEDNDEIKG